LNQPSDPTPLHPTPLATLLLPAQYSKPTAYFCRAAIRYATIHVTEEKIAKEEEEENKFSFKPKLCKNSLKIDKNLRKKSFFNADDRVDVMMRSAANVQMKVKKKKAELDDEEIKECSWKPKINSDYKFKDAPPAASGGEPLSPSSREDSREDSRERKSSLRGSSSSVGSEEESSLPKEGHVKIRVVQFRERTVGPVDNGNQPLSIDMLNVEEQDDYACDNPTDSERGRTMSGASIGSTMSRQSIQGWDGPIPVQEYLAKSAHERLYERRPHPKKQEVTRVASLEERELKMCTFQPKINKGKRELKDRVDVKRRNTWFGLSLATGIGGSPKERKDHLDQERVMRMMSGSEGRAASPGRGRIDTLDHDGNDTVPEGFDKAIKRAKEVNKSREDKMKYAENAGYTEESYQKAMSLKKQAAKAPTFKHEKKKREIKLYMDVKLGKGKKGRIALRDGDRPEVLAKSFARVHSLGRDMEIKLTGVVEQYMRVNGIVVSKAKEKMKMEEEVEEENAERDVRGVREKN